MDADSAPVGLALASDGAHPGPSQPSKVPRLHVREASGATRAVVLVLHGGKARSMRPASRRQFSAVRMVPFARAMHRAGRDAGLAVWSLGYRDRGWTGGDGRPAGSQVQDALWALRQIRDRHPGVPVYLVGHSLGGRTALAAGADPAVRAVVALAPWTPAGEAVEHLRGTPALILHGARDRWVAPSGSLDFAERARAAGVDVQRYAIRRAGHAMFRRRALWQGLATYFVTSRLLDGEQRPDGVGLQVPL